MHEEIAMKNDHHRTLPYNLNYPIATQNILEQLPMLI